MMFEGRRRRITQEEEEEEEGEEIESLIMSSSYYGGGGGGGMAPVTVVEYMVSSMSNELLCKFPDNSAFDFDYTQSSIWSPLLPHPSSIVLSSSSSSLQRKLSYDDEDDGFLWHNSTTGCNAAATTTVGAAVLKKLTSTIRDTIGGSSVLNCFQIPHKISSKKKMRMMTATKNKKKRSSFKGFDNFSPIPSNSSAMAAAPASTHPTPSKGWAKVLKAASTKFKKTLKKKDSAARLKLSSGLSSRNTKASSE